MGDISRHIAAAGAVHCAAAGVVPYRAQDEPALCALRRIVVDGIQNTGYLRGIPNS